MLYLILLFLMCSLYFYVESFKSALSARRWGAVGILLRPNGYPYVHDGSTCCNAQSIGFQ